MLLLNVGFEKKKIKKLNTQFKFFFLCNFAYVLPDKCKICISFVFHYIIDIIISIKIIIK